jgi:hypothetical protein
VGDTWVAPVFEILRRRGVKFELFHRVWNLQTRDGRISEIVLEQQAKLKEKCDGIYQPFIEVKGRKAWPEHPRYKQLRNADELKGLNLEDFYSPRRGTTHPLKHSDDFDTVVYAMPVETINTYCKPILNEQANWRELVKRVRGTDTQTMWAYFHPNLKGLGWHNKPPILTSYLAPFSTWEDVTFLEKFETWPAGNVPGSICSLMGPLPGPVQAPPPDDPDGYPERQQQAARDSCWRFFNEQVYPIWPGVTREDDPNGVDWDALIDLSDRAGAKRFEAQVWKANCGPAQRYTLSLAGSVKYRLRTDESGYANLYLAGDWVRNGSDIGTVEGAVSSGLQAAVAISGIGSVSVPGLPDTGL